MNIIYLGAFPPEFMVKRSGGRIDSLYRAHCPLIKGLRERDDVNIKVITSPDVVSWPEGPFFVRHEMSEEENLTLVSSLNLPFLKQLWTIISMIVESGKFIRGYKQVVVIIPYVVFRHVVTLRLLKLFFPSRVVQVAVVPDVFFPNSRKGKIINKWTERMAMKFDAYLFYTKKMAQHFHAKIGAYEVIEGYQEIDSREPEEEGGFRVVYTGSLNMNYGVPRLIEAMRLIDDEEVELHLYGSGTAEEIICKAAKEDQRIVYHGRVPKASAVDAIYKAAVLINPRNGHDGQYTEYSFPSKDIEYMATGIPTLLCKLPGMPQEYDGFFIDMGDAAPSQIAESILKVKNMSAIERKEIGSKAKSFIRERMSYDKQAVRIVSLLEKVINNNIVK